MMAGARRPEAVSAWIGLGSNLHDPVAQLHSALDALGAVDDIRVLRCSSFYRSSPMGPQDQPDFINAAAELHTTLSPLNLLDVLQAIEQAQGRKRERHWGPRTLDLDLLLYGTGKISTSRLRVPHPGLPERSFVLYPLAELEPGLEVPGFGTVQALCRQRTPAGLQRLTEPGNDRHPA